MFAIIQISSGKIKISDIKYNDLDVTNIVESEFRRSGIQLYHWLMYEGTRNLLKYFKFDSAYMTYENIAWENMFIMSLKQFSCNTKIIGYQHSVVPQSAAGIIQDLEFFIPLKGLIDINKEIERLQKQVDDMEGRLRSVNKKLDNENFIKRAPNDIIKHEKNKQMDYKNSLTKLLENLNSLKT